MKCNNCGFNNREGIKFCEECGQQLKEEVNPLCPSCGFSNRENVKFCEQCGTKLSASEPAPATLPPSRRKFAPQVGPSNPAPQSVVVEVGGRKRQVRRSYLLILLVLLLLFLLCGCLFFTEVIAAPVFITDIFNEYTRLGFGCLNGIFLLFSFYLIILILRLDFNCIYVPIGLLILTILCVILGFIGIIDLPDFVDDVIDRVVDPIRVLPLPWNPDEQPPWEPDDPSPPKNPSGKCCPDYRFNNIYYDNGHLFFDITCRTQDIKDQCAEGKVYDGAGKFWTEVSCCVDPDYNMSVLRCEGLDYVTAKVGNVRIEMEYEGSNGKICRIEESFPPPSFSVPEDTDTDSTDSVPEDTDTDSTDSSCPSGESMCAGSCCSAGHCCDCGSGMGCYSDCSSCY